jgi:hypothetical protein
MSVLPFLVADGIVKVKGKVVPVLN